MSIQWIAWVMDSSPARLGERLVHLSLANHANDEGYCFPSIATIAREANLSRGATEKALKGLSDAGWVLRRTHGAPAELMRKENPAHFPNLYQLTKTQGEFGALRPVRNRGSRRRGV